MDSRTNGLWRHILLGSDGGDDGHGSTGNAWAADGMIRTLGTIYNSPFNASMTNQTADLVSWISKIHKGMYTNLVSRLTFPPSHISDLLSRTQTTSSRITLIKLSRPRTSTTHHPLRSWPAPSTDSPPSPTYTHTFPTPRNPAKYCLRTKARPLLSDAGTSRPTKSDGRHRHL